MVSPAARAGCACASTITGGPPSWAMPTSNDSRVRVEFFSKSTATAFGPAKRRLRERVGLQRVREVEHLGLLGGREVVVAQEVAQGHHQDRPSRSRGTCGVQDGGQRRRRTRRPGPR